MKQPLEELKCELLTLSAHDRAELASLLLESLHEDEDGDPEAVKAAWDKELRKRMEEIKSGKVVGIPAEEVFVEMRRKYP